MFAALRSIIGRSCAAIDILHADEVTADRQLRRGIPDRLEPHPAVDRHRSIVRLDPHRRLGLELDHLHRPLGGAAEACGPALDDGPHADGTVGRGLELQARVPAWVVLDVVHGIEVPHDGDRAFDDGRGFEFHRFLPFMVRHC